MKAMKWLGAYKIRKGAVGEKVKILKWLEQVNLSLKMEWVNY